MRENEDRKKNEYWDRYYSRQNPNDLTFIPSQFAVFCVQEMMEAGISDLVEIAAGTGRDTLFFAQHGMRILALDKSQEAVNLLNKITETDDNVSVAAHDVTEAFPVVAERGSAPFAFYARFFVHTLTENELGKFFENVSRNMRQDDLLFLEYRNEEDADKTKVTEDHFRAFYGADRISDLCVSNDLELVYEVSGTGFAKWKKDDASITRQIFRYRTEG